MPATDRYTIISSDCHAGGSHEQYRGYLEQRWLDEFDAWRGRYSNPFRDLQDDGRSRNWDDERRIREQNADGVIAEVVFPNTVPPFFPTGAVVAPAPSVEDFERRLAGLRAHNRWMVDHCAVQPERRAGLVQIFLNDVDEAIADVRWGHEHGLKAVLLLGVSPDTPWIQPLFSAVYDPLWAVCEELGMPLTHHAGGSGIPAYPKTPATTFIFVMEAPFFANRALWHLIMSGVFERFPNLKLVCTEQGTAWIPDVLTRMDGYHEQAVRGRIGELGLSPDAVLKRRPSEYFATNVWVGSSFPAPSDADVMRQLGVDRIMWGSDYPHHEGTYPYTRESLRRTFAGWDEASLRAVLAENAAAVYGFELDALAPIAAEHGPTVTEIATPLTEIPADATSPAFMRA